MKKIPTLFERERGKMIPVVNELAAWVLEEPSFAVRKYDGTCMMLSDMWYYRREVKNGKTIPKYFVEVDHDRITGHRFGWMPVLSLLPNGIGYERYSYIKQFEEALDNTSHPMFGNEFKPGTYELIGPKINQNNEGKSKHWLIPHAQAEQLGNVQALELEHYDSVEEAFNDLRRTLQYMPIEGVIFKSLDGNKLAKLKVKDFDA